jgi:hypothetical protein
MVEALAYQHFTIKFLLSLALLLSYGSFNSCRYFWGWFTFKFASAEDALWVLKSPWSIDSTPILFKLWTPLFDARKEQLDIVPIWVNLPCLPLELWSKEIFKMIGKM